MGAWHSQPPLLPPKRGIRPQWTPSNNPLAQELYRAWWGQPIIEHEIKRNFVQHPHLEVDLEHSVDGVPLGRILLRKEYIQARDVLMQAALWCRGYVVSGQTGLGES